MKTTNISKTKRNETNAWFRSTFMPSGQEMDQVHPAAPRACMGIVYWQRVQETTITSNL